jgi:hypothetical protein
MFGREGEEFRYPSYVEDIMGPMCFDYGFGPFRWVCTSGDPKGPGLSDRIAADVLEGMLPRRPPRSWPADRRQPALDPQRRTEQAGRGQQARILYADAEGRIRIAEAFNMPSAARSAAHRAGPRPPRRERHRQSLPRNQQHPRRQPLHGRHGRAQLSSAMRSGAPPG